MRQRILLGTPKQVALGLLVLRIAFGVFMLVHGTQKLMGFSTLAESFPDPLGMGHQLSLICAIGTEVGCSVLLILGLGTRIAVLNLAFTMLVALFLVHTNDPWKVRELAAVYLAVYAVIFVTGPGGISLDQKLFGKCESEVKQIRGDLRAKPSRE